MKMELYILALLTALITILMVGMYFLYSKMNKIQMESHSRASELEAVRKGLVGVDTATEELYHLVTSSMGGGSAAPGRNVTEYEENSENDSENKIN